MWGERLVQFGRRGPRLHVVQRRARVQLLEFLAQRRRRFGRRADDMRVAVPVGVRHEVSAAAVGPAPVAQRGRSRLGRRQLGPHVRGPVAVAGGRAQAEQHRCHQGSWCTPGSGARLRGMHGGHSGKSICRPKALTDEKVALAGRMHDSGESATTIAATLGVNRATVYRCLARTPRPLRRGGLARVVNRHGAHESVGEHVADGVDVGQ